MTTNKVKYKTKETFNKAFYDCDHNDNALDDTLYFVERNFERKIDSVGLAIFSTLCNLTEKNDHEEDSFELR